VPEPTGFLLQSRFLEGVDGVPDKPFQALYFGLSLGNSRVIASPLAYERPGSSILVEQPEEVLFATSHVVSPLSFGDFGIEQDRGGLGTAEATPHLEGFIEG